MEDTSDAAKGGLFSGSRSTAVETPRTAAPVRGRTVDQEPGSLFTGGGTDDAFTAREGPPGPQGPQGPRGRAGEMGTPGFGIDNVTITPSNAQPGDTVTLTVSYEGSTRTSAVTFTIPENGAAGSGIANIAIDTGQSVGNGTRYRLTITYDDGDSNTVDFIAPVGPQGIQGNPGNPGTDASDIDSVTVDATDPTAATFTFTLENGDTVGPSNAINIQGPMGNQGDPGAGLDNVVIDDSDPTAATFRFQTTAGNTFTSNAVDIEGPQGPTGPQGSRGPVGPDGQDAPILSTVSIDDTDPTQATFTFTDTDSNTIGPSNVVNIQGPQGARGEQGDRGLTGPAGSNGRDGTDGTNASEIDTVTVEASNPQAATFTFTLANGTVLSPTNAVDIEGPQGPAGPAGSAGSAGPRGRGITSITKVGELVTVLFTDNTTSTFTVPNGADGGIGPIGPAGNGIVTIVQIPASPTLGQASTVQVTTTDGQVQSLQLPAGAQGVAGPRGPTGADGADGVSLTVLDEGINPISTVSMLDFTGEGVVVSDEGSGRAQVQIDGATPLVLFDEGNRLSSDLASVNFVGTGVTATTVGDDATITITSGTMTPELTVEDEGRAIDTNVGNIDFVGDGVVVSDNGVGSVTVTIAGGGGVTPPPAHADIRVTSSLTEATAPFTGNVTYTVNITSSNPLQGTFTFQSITNATSSAGTPTVNSDRVSVAYSGLGVGTYTTSFTVNYRDNSNNAFSTNVSRTLTIDSPWFADVRTSVPADNNDLTNRGVYSSGSRVTFTGNVSNPTIYIALPTGTYNFRTGLAFISGTRVTTGYTQSGFDLYSFGTIGSGENITIEVQDG